MESELRYRKRITDGRQQCSKTSSFPVQVLMPKKVSPYGQCDKTLYNKIQSMYTNQKPKDNCPYQLVANSNTSSGYDIVSKNIAHTPVSSLFFSKKNIDALQIGLSNTVFNMSNGRFNISVGSQSDIELKIVMRSIYFDYLQNGFKNVQYHSGAVNTYDKDVLNQVKLLNSAVLKWCAKEIITNMEQFEHYKYVAIENEGKQHVMDYGIATSKVGTKSNQNFIP